MEVLQMQQTTFIEIVVVPFPWHDICFLEGQKEMKVRRVGKNGRGKGVAGEGGEGIDVSA